MLPVVLVRALSTASSCTVALRSELPLATGSSFACALAPFGAGATAVAADPGFPNALHILNLLLTGDFPRIWVPSWSHEYRPLVELPLVDKVIDCLTARYLREALDEKFRDSALAFRCRKDSLAAPTIHDALRKILAVNRRNRKSGLYVAECDIKSFYDCVSHELVVTSLKRLIAEQRPKHPPVSIDTRAWIIVRAYLRAYSFSTDVYPVDSEANRLLRKTDAKGKYKWPIGDLQRLHRSKNLPRIGVPQGSALSCFFANAVLHAADQEMQKIRRKMKKQFTYLRYCDDMILLCRNHLACAAAFNAYCRAVRSLALPIHEPSPVKGYSTPMMKREFWASKSNRPYHWARREGQSIPWIQFLGYQIRYDGLVRVRPKSLRKEFTKLRGAADKLLRILQAPNKAAIARSRSAIKHRFRMKLISMAVGRKQLGPAWAGPLPMCWANGFKGLVGQKFVSNRLKDLDRHREKQIRLVERRLNLLALPTAKGEKTPKVNRFYGFPFSYWAQFGRF